MKHKWLAQGIVADMDVEHTAASVAEQSTVTTELGKADEARRHVDEMKRLLEGAKEEAEKRRAELAEADPETHALERDQHNAPVIKWGTRKQRRSAISKKGANKRPPVPKHRKKKPPRRRRR